MYLLAAIAISVSLSLLYSLVLFPGHPEIHIPLSAVTGFLLGLGSVMLESRRYRRW